MQGIFVKGPDALKFLDQLACNKLSASIPNRAHQIILVNEDGMLVGDGIVFHLAENLLSVYGAPYAPNWIKYQAELSHLRIEIEMDYRSPVYANGHASERKDCRYQLQGPLAEQLIEKLNGGPVGDVKFFHMTDLTIAGHRVRGLRHGMAGAKGLEIWGPYEHRDAIRDAILAAGEEFGIAPVGALAYLTTAAESGWIAGPLPAVYTGEKLRGYREWLPSTEVEGLQRLSGSYASDRVEDYYYTPYELGYGHILSFDHEFLGRDALRKIDPASRRKKVSIAWNSEDVGRLMAELANPSGGNYKQLHIPIVFDKLEPTYDKITVGGKFMGTGNYTAYSANERAVITLSTVDQSLKIGDEVILHWGEAGGGSGKGKVEPTESFEVRGIISPTPFAKVVREEYTSKRGH